MSAQKKNLLEAFSNAGKDTPLSEARKSAPVPKETSPAPAPKPVASEPTRAATVPVRPEAPRTQRDASDLVQDSPRRPSRDFTALVPVAAAAILAFVAGLFVGRSSLEPVLAAPVEPAPALSEPAGLAPSRPTTQSEPARIEESPLFVASNRYTVVVQTYTPENSDLAWATYHHLRDERLPVFPPVESRPYLLVLVGAAPNNGDLADLEQSVRGLSRNGRTKVYPDAYRAKIDDLIDR